MFYRTIHKAPHPSQRTVSYCIQGLGGEGGQLLRIPSCRPHPLRDRLAFCSSILAEELSRVPPLIITSMGQQRVVAQGWGNFGPKLGIFGAKTYARPMLDQES
jgi:hypothetical protein